MLVTITRVSTIIKTVCFFLLLELKVSKCHLRACYEQYISKTEKPILKGINVKPFRSFVNHNRKSHSLLNEMRLNNYTTNNVQDIANQFSTHFGSVYSSVSVNSLVSNSNSPIHMSSLNVNISEVFVKINNLSLYRWNPFISFQTL